MLSDDRPTNPAGLPIFFLKGVSYGKCVGDCLLYTSIAKNLALQLGGDITLESQPYQKTIFTITLKKMAY